MLIAFWVLPFQVFAGGGFQKADVANIVFAPDRSAIRTYAVKVHITGTPQTTCPQLMAQYEALFAPLKELNVAMTSDGVVANCSDWKTKEDVGLNGIQFIEPYNEEDKAELNQALEVLKAQNSVDTELQIIELPYVDLDFSIKQFAKGSDPASITFHRAKQIRFSNYLDSVIWYEEFRDHVGERPLDQEIPFMVGYVFDAVSMQELIQTGPSSRDVFVSINPVFPIQGIFRTMDIEHYSCDLIDRNNGWCLWRNP